MLKKFNEKGKLQPVVRRRTLKLAILLDIYTKGGLDL